VSSADFVGFRGFAQRKTGSRTVRDQAVVGQGMDLQRMATRSSGEAVSLNNHLARQTAQPLAELTIGSTEG
jgi:hypothetical protein